MLMSERAKHYKFRLAPYLTKAAAAYPGGLNDLFASKLKRAVGDGSSKAAAWKLAGKWKNVLLRDESGDLAGGQVEPVSVVPKLSWAPSLRGLISNEDSDVHLGGMRHPRKAMEVISGYDRIGKVVYHTLDRYLEEHPTLQQQCLDSLGSNDPDFAPDPGHIAAIARKLEALFGLEGRQTERGLDHCILGAWGQVAGDPDTSFIKTWLEEGAPAGISAPVRDPGIFPQEEAAPDFSGDFDSFHDPTGHENYKSVEEDSAALPEIERLIQTGYVKTFQELTACQQWLGGAPLTSKLAMVTKERPGGTTKRRLILDCRESGANLLAHKGGRVQLPRPTDLVDDALYLLNRAGGEQVEALVLDFKDWFYSVPLRRDERRFFTTAY